LPKTYCLHLPHLCAQRCQFEADEFLFGLIVKLHHMPGAITSEQAGHAMLAAGIDIDCLRGADSLQQCTIRRRIMCAHCSMCKKDCRTRILHGQCSKMQNSQHVKINSTLQAKSASSTCHPLKIHQNIVQSDAPASTISGLQRHAQQRLPIAAAQLTSCFITKLMSRWQQQQPC
jgi:uncharacterized protein YydD (DUF2326 family)